MRQQIKHCDKRSFWSAGASCAGSRRRYSCLSVNTTAPEQWGLPRWGLCQKHYHHQYQVAGSTWHYVQRSPEGHWTFTLWLKAKMRLSPQMPPNKHTHQAARDANLSGAVTTRSTCACWQEGNVKKCPPCLRSPPGRRNSGHPHCPLHSPCSAFCSLQPCPAHSSSGATWTASVYPKQRCFFLSVGGDFLRWVFQSRSTDWHKCYYTEKLCSKHLKCGQSSEKGHSCQRELCRSLCTDSKGII